MRNFGALFFTVLLVASACGNSSKKESLQDQTIAELKQSIVMIEKSLEEIESNLSYVNMDLAYNYASVDHNHLKKSSIFNESYLPCTQANEGGVTSYFFEPEFIWCDEINRLSWKVWDLNEKLEELDSRR